MGTINQLRRKKLRRLAVLSLMLNAEKKKNKRRWWVRPIFRDHDTHGAWLTLIPVMREQDPEMFYNFLRMWPEHFDEILDLVEPFVKKTSWRKSICPGERLAITLRKLASGDSNMSLQFLFRVSNEVIGHIFLETSHVVWKVLSLDPTVFPPLNTDQWLKIAGEFEAMWNFPHCLGAIDGVHIHCKAFPRTGSLFFNYKKRFSISVMAVADAKQRLSE